MGFIPTGNITINMWCMEEKNKNEFTVPITVDDAAISIQLLHNYDTFVYVEEYEAVGNECTTYMKISSNRAVSVDSYSGRHSFVFISAHEVTGVYKVKVGNK